MGFLMKFLRLYSPQAISIIWSSKSSFKLRYTSFRHQQRLIPLMICSTTTQWAEIWRFYSLSCGVRHLFRGFFFGSMTVTPFPMLAPLKPKSHKITEPSGNRVCSSSAIFLSCFLPEWVFPKYLICLSAQLTMTLFLTVWNFFYHYSIHAGHHYLQGAGFSALFRQ
jgi:hypothetical protein